MYYKSMYYIMCSTTKYYEGEQRQIKAKQKSMSKHTIDLYTINYRVIIIKNRIGSFPMRVYVGIVFPHENKTKPKKHTKKNTNTYPIWFVLISLFLSIQPYIYLLN